MTKEEQAHGFYCGSVVDDMGLSAAEFRLLLHLSRRVHKETGIANCGIRKMTQVCKLSEKTISAAIKELESRKLIEVIHREFGQSNHYRLISYENWTCQTVPQTPTVSGDDDTTTSENRPSDSHGDRPLDSHAFAKTVPQIPTKGTTRLGTTKGTTRKNAHARESDPLADKEAIQEGTSHDLFPGPTSVAADAGKTVTKERAFESESQSKQIHSLPSERTLAKKKKVKPRLDVDSVPIPLLLRVPAFITAWKDWHTHRAQGKFRSYTEIGIKNMLAELETHGVEASVAAIKFSIARNYQGIIFREQSGNNNNHRHPVDQNHQREKDRLISEINTIKL
jgi:hypothetical protein